MSGLRCWPGCLARINRAVMPENVGMVVEVLRRAGADEDGPLWQVTLPRPSRGVLLGTNYVVTTNHESATVTPDAWMTPITPPPGTESTTTDADKPVEVQA